MAENIETTGKTKQSTKLDGLLGHLSSCSGLYSRETFISLYSCITRMIRDQRREGLVLTRTLGDEAFDTMLLALTSLSQVSLFHLDALVTNTPMHFYPSAGLSEQTGFLLALTDRFSAAIYWTADTREAFGMYNGGWTFHPTDCRTIATHLSAHLSEPNLKCELESKIRDAAIDRRYDEKFTDLLTPLVNSLENRNRELILALERVNDLNRRVLESERLAAIGQLCAVIAHEIRNPLGLIDLYSKLAEAQVQQLDAVPNDRSAVLETLVKNLQQIRSATSSLETILSELSDYSRPLQLNLEWVDPFSLVEEVCEFYRPSFQEKNIRLESLQGMESLEIRILLDAARIRQALINLLKNAQEASPPGSTVQVSIASRKTDEFLYIKVSDQGPGVNIKTRARLFTPYFSTKGSGTGLGLAHSRKILQAHGGNVDLLATSPDGATFALILPKSTVPEF